jgi:zona occludens toxin
MLIFSEGVPRSGKSYDAVKNHILPALKSGRRVYARINGLDADRIAAHLGMESDRVRELLVVVGTSEVVPLFRAEQSADGEWTIALEFQNALVVIDEVHDFYVGGTREALDKEVEQFFALHGHYGMDVLVMTQFYKRVHTAIRYRIERKNTFQKLSALGKKGEGMYLETFYQTVAPDRYEKVATSTHTYDQTIWPLYHGIVDGGASGVTQSVYDGGRKTVWGAMKWKAAIMVPLLVGALWFLVSFLHGNQSLVTKTKIGGGHAQQLGAVYQPVGKVNASEVQEQKKPVDEFKGLTDEQKYIWKLSDDNRPRLAAKIGSGINARGLVEWVGSDGVAKERLTLGQLRDLGVAVVSTGYGVKLIAAKLSQIVTSWPLDTPLRDERPQLYNTSGDSAGARVSDSEPQPPLARGGSTGGTPVRTENHAFYGGIRGQVGTAPPAEGISFAH